MLISFLKSEFVNPEHIEPVDGLYPEPVYSRVPSTMRKLSYIYASLVLLAVSLVYSAPKKDEKLELSEVQQSEDLDARLNASPLNQTKSTLTYSTTLTDLEEEIEPTFKQCLKSKMFWILYVMSSLSVGKENNLLDIYCSLRLLHR